MGQAIQWAPIKVVPRWNFWIIYYEASEGSEAKSAAKVQDPVRMEISAWAWSFCGTWFGGLLAFQRQTTGGSVTTLCDLLQKSWRLPENDISSWLIFVCIHTYYIYELIIYYISYIKYYILCIIYYVLLCVCEYASLYTVHPNRNTQYRMHISVLKVVEKGSCLDLTSIDKAFLGWPTFGSLETLSVLCWCAFNELHSR